MGETAMRVSVIIPTLNESANIEAALASVEGAENVETIVVDGGSTDDTLQKCGAANRVITTAKGRANQQNVGAAAATGEILLFLHADCRLQPGCLAAVRKACGNDDCVGGCFKQQIDAAGAKFRALEWGNGLRVRCFRLAYGDQGIFVRADVFRRLGGFPPLALMEDLFFMKRLRREGRFLLLRNRLIVSARRWQQRGVLRQTLTNWTLASLAQLGVSPSRLVAFYTDDR